MSAWGTTGPPADLDQNGTVDSADLQVLTSNLSAPGTPAPQTGIHYYHPDALGSPVAATDEGGNILWKEIYAPFGERILKQAANGQGRGHTGHYQDETTGFVYAGARYYDPLIGRFLAIDPVDADPEDQRKFNRYAYGANSPYLYVDRDGRDFLYERETHGSINDDIYNEAGRVGIPGLAAAALIVVTEGLATPYVGADAAALLIFAATGGEALPGLRTGSPILKNGADPRSISPNTAQQIQNAADFGGVDVTVIGSRASGTARPDSDFDFVVPGNARTRSKVKSKLPKGRAGGEQTASGGQSGIDVFRPGEVDLSSQPHIIFEPKK